MENNTELAEKYNALLKEFNQTLKDAIATELKYKELNTKAKIQEAGIELLAEKHLKLKERCEKMEGTIRLCLEYACDPDNDSDPGITLWNIHNLCKEQLPAQPLKEGESNTPAPAKEIEYMPILSAELYELRAFSNVPVRVPLHLLDKDQAMANHGQTLQRLKERGGLSIKEALSLMTLKRWMHYKDMPMVKAIAMLNDLISNNNPH